MFNQLGGAPSNPNKDLEVTSPPDDTVSALEFSPPSLPQTFLVSGSWDCRVRCWEVEASGKTVPKAVQSMDGPVLDVAWHDDGSKIFMASTDKSVKCWDLASNQSIQVAAHEAPVKTCHWIKAPNYTCLMTASWDKTLKFWDTRSAVPIMNMNLSERCYCADVDYPMAVVGTADRGICLYTLEGKPGEFKRVESPLKHQHRCIAIFRDKKTKQPTGFALGSVEGRVAIQYVNPTNPKDNFTFKCHRPPANTTGYQASPLPLALRVRRASTVCHVVCMSCAGHLRGERHRVPPGARHAGHGGLGRLLLVLGQGRAHAPQVLGDAGPASHQVRLQPQRTDFRIRRRIRLVQGPRALQPGQEELHLPARLLRGPQAALHVSIPPRPSFILTHTHTHAHTL